MTRKKATKSQDSLKSKTNSLNDSSKEAVKSSTELKEELNQKQEAEDQFELELYWCIQHLQQGLEDLKLEKKQKYNVTASLNALTNNKTSIVKKRQVMRNTFGDYRTLMAEEEKKFSRKTTLVKFVNDKKKKKSVFIKKANCCTDTTKENKFKYNDSSDDKADNTDIMNEPFKFNFPLQNL